MPDLKNFSSTGRKDKEMKKQNKKQIRFTHQKDNI